LQRAEGGKLAPFSKDDEQKDERNRARSQQVGQDVVQEEELVGEWGWGEEDESVRARASKKRERTQSGPRLVADVCWQAVFDCQGRCNNGSSNFLVKHEEYSLTQLAKRRLGIV
jgi:hypothetical protein